MRSISTSPTGKLAYEILGVRLPLQVLQSAAGYYLGTFDENGPVSRESAEYWQNAQDAETALATGPETWTQRETP